jgi:hypothetical protein
MFERIFVAPLTRSLNTIRHIILCGSVELWKNKINKIALIGDFICIYAKKAVTLPVEIEN